MPREFFNKKVGDEQKARLRRAAINKSNRDGTNMFFQAIESGNLGDVEKLFDEGARLDARTASRGFISSMIVNVPYSTGATPLHAACLLGSPDIVAFLIDKGADLKATDDEGHTPLDYAILSHSYYEAYFEQKSSSRFTFRSTVEKAQNKVEDYESVILKVMQHGGKPGLFALPNKFKADGPQKPKGPAAPPAP